MNEAERESFWECVRIVAKRASAEVALGMTTRGRATQVLDQLDAMKATSDEEGRS